MKTHKKRKNSSTLKKITTSRIKRRRIHKIFYFCRYTVKNIPQIFSPHNTTQYLIENNSSPFYDEDDEEDFDLNINLNPLISLDSESIIFSSIFREETSCLKDSYQTNELSSTAAQSQEIPDFKFIDE